MKVFVDTNVLISAFVSHTGRCADLLEHCTSVHTVFTSQFVLGEFADKLRSKFKYPQDEIEHALRIVLSAATVVSESSIPRDLCRDPDDNRVIAAAVTAMADCIITGDKDLLDLRNTLGITIVSPSNFGKFEKDRALGGLR
jgi:uncharacterized protein